MPRLWKADFWNTGRDRCISIVAIVRLIHLLVLGLAVSLIHGIVVAEDPPRLFSCRLSMMVAAGLPKFDPKQASGSNSGQTEVRPSKAIPALAQPDGVIRLPTFAVHASRLLTEDEVLTDKGRAELAMNRYLGPADGIDRGLLNAYTLPGLWKKIPVLGRIPCMLGGMTNETRAMWLYKQDMRAPLK
jgi:hypothetical protein